MKTKYVTRCCIAIFLAGTVQTVGGQTLGGQTVGGPGQMGSGLGIGPGQTPGSPNLPPLGTATDRIPQFPATRGTTRDALDSSLERITELPARDPIRLPSMSELPELPDMQALPALTDRLPELPERVEVLNRDGTRALVDVRVENGWRAVERQWLVMLDSSEIDLLNHPGIDIIDQTLLPALGLNLVRLQVAPELDSKTAMERVLPPALIERLDRNHIYGPQSSLKSNPDEAQPGIPSAYGCEAPVVVGMLDTAIQTDHPSLRGNLISQKHFNPDMEEPTNHGTAVASVLVGQLPGQGRAQMPNAELRSASVFFNRQDLSTGATLGHLVEGLNWLVSEDAQVINISLAGPDNVLLETVTRRVSEGGVALVAAVGNQGPAAPALYPAAYPHVIGVTAVDGKRQVYRWANQGSQVAFAAPGVDLLLANGQGTYTRQSGTSMATPLVSARVACALAGGKTSVAAVVEALAAQALDLGATGPDPVFGHGFLSAE